MNLRKLKCRAVATLLFFITGTGASMAQIMPVEKSISNVFPWKAHSPYEQHSFPSPVYRGNTHLHTRLSVDAGLFGNTHGLEQACRFARGIEISTPRWVVCDAFLIGIDVPEQAHTTKRAGLYLANLVRAGGMELC